MVETIEKMVIGSGLTSLAIVLIKQNAPQINIETVGILFAGGSLAILLVTMMTRQRPNKP